LDRYEHESPTIAAFVERQTLALIHDISQAPIGDYVLSDPPREIIRIQFEKGCPAAQATPMLWPSGVDLIDTQHSTTGLTPDIEYHIVPNACLAGGGALPRHDNRYLFAPSFLPDYIPHYVRNDIDKQHWEPPPHSSARRVPIGISIIHNNLVFGHWLLEMFPKLLMLKSMTPELRTAPIILPSTAPPYVRRTIGELLGDWPVVVYDRFTEHVEVDTLILPGAFHRNYHFHPSFEALIDEHMAWARSSVGAKLRSATRLPKRRRKLFISRANISSSFRRLANAARLEDLAVEMGFSIIRPEALSWRRQVEIFSHAEVVAGEFGSGMHNTLFAPKDAKVVCLNWLVEVQSRISNFRRQRVGYVMPKGDQPKLFVPGEQFEYEVDVEQCRQALKMALD
jgi:capsular polysaccharide biosynthesis protein